jgi:simple sugar transport system permease protein
MAGAHLSTSYSKSWIEGTTAGRGWIVIALTIFALWNPGRAIGAAFFYTLLDKKQRPILKRAHM